MICKECGGTLELVDCLPPLYVRGSWEYIAWPCEICEPHPEESTNWQYRE